MENLIPVLIIIVLFIFQTINNYRKEQEKARKRNTGAPRPGGAPAPARTTPQPEATIREARMQREAAQEQLSSPYEAYQGQLATIEPVRKKTSSKAPLRAEAYRLSDPENDEVEEDEMDRIRNNFNMKEAVIMSAILERPYA